MDKKLNLTFEALTDTDRERLYLEALEKWAKRVAMWNRKHKGPPPVFLDQNGKAHWANRASRRKGGSL